MAPLILHNVPDDECYVGEDGVKRPYAMIFNQYVHPALRSLRQTKLTILDSAGKTLPREALGHDAPLQSPAPLANRRDAPDPAQQPPDEVARTRPWQSPTSCLATGYRINRLPLQRNRTATPRLSRMTHSRRNSSNNSSNRRSSRRSDPNLPN